MSIVPFCPIRRALQQGDRTEAIRLIQEEGHDPFKSYQGPHCGVGLLAVENQHLLTLENKLWNRTAFHEAADHHDLDLLLVMAAANPSNKRTAPRYFVSQGVLKDAPCEGRACIPHAKLESTIFYPATNKKDFHVLQLQPEITGDRLLGVSMESLEVMLAYGYDTLNDGEWDSILTLCLSPHHHPPSCVLAPQHLEIVHFCVAAGLLPDEEHHRKTLLATSMYYILSMGGQIGVLKSILEAGVDPNGVTGRKFGVDIGLPPPLFTAALCKKYGEIQLLLQYGADANEALNYDTNDASSLTMTELRFSAEASIAEAKEMLSSLTQPETVRHADLEKYTLQLQRKFDARIKPVAVDFVAPLVVACMRLTDAKAPPELGLMSKLVLEYCPPGDFDLWKIRL